MDRIKYQLAVISDQLAVHAGVLFFWTGWQDSKIVVMCILKILFILSGILKSDPVHPENPVWRILV